MKKIVFILSLVITFPFYNILSLDQKDIKYYKNISNNIKNEELKKAIKIIIDKNNIPEGKRANILFLALKHYYYKGSYSESKKQKKDLSFILIKFFIDNGFDPNIKIFDHNLIHWAIFMNKINIIKFLLNKNIDLKSNFGGETPLHWAVACGNLEIVKILIKRYDNLNLKTEYLGITPLHIACSGNYYKIAKLLLENGANPNIKDNNSYRLAIDFAMKTQNSNLISLIIKYTQKQKKYFDQIKQNDKIRLNLLKKSIENDDSKIFSLLLKAFGYSYKKIIQGQIIKDLKGREYESNDYKEFTILEFAIKLKRMNIVKTILNYNIDNKKEKIHNAICNSFFLKNYDKKIIKIIKLLISYYIKSNIRNKKGDAMILHSVISNNRIEILQFLLNKNFDVNSQLDEGDLGTPLHNAAFRGNKKIAEILIKHGAKINTQIFGETPLDCAKANSPILPLNKVSIILIMNGGKFSRELKKE